MVLAISAIEAKMSSAASPAVSAFTRPVADRILSVSSSRLRTSSMASSRGCPAPVSELTTEASLSGSSGVTRNDAGSGFVPSSSAPSSKALGFFSRALSSASALEMNSTDFTPSVSSSAVRSSVLLRLRGGLLDVDVRHHPAAHLVGGAGGGLHDRDEHAEHERGEQHGEKRRERRARSCGGGRGGPP